MSSLVELIDEKNTHADVCARHEHNMCRPTRAYEDRRLAGVTESSVRNAVALNEFCTLVSCIPSTCLSVVDWSQ